VTEAAAQTRSIPRMFAAVSWRPDESAALRELQSLLRGAPGAGSWRWTQPEDLHLTLRFYGDASQAQADGAGATLERLAGADPQAPLEFERLEAWTGVVVARCAAVPALQALQVQLEREAQALGFAPEPRPWAPHVTLARLPRDGAVELPRVKLAPFALPVARLALCCHAPPADAPRRYATLASFPIR
jgi:2'-5' RNA ligase